VRFYHRLPGTFSVAEYNEPFSVHFFWGISTLYLALWRVVKGCGEPSDSLMTEGHFSHITALEEPV